MFWTTSGVDLQTRDHTANVSTFQILFWAEKWRVSASNLTVDISWKLCWQQATWQCAFRALLMYPSKFQISQTMVIPQVTHPGVYAGIGCSTVPATHKGEGKLKFCILFI